MIQPGTSETLRWVEPAGVASPALADTIDIAVFSDLAAVEPLWRRLEAGAIRSIYQRFDWLDSWQRHAGVAARTTPAIVTGIHRGEAMFVLPLGRRRWGPVRFATWLGGSHVNTGIGLYHPDFVAGMTAEDATRLGRRIVAALRPVDVVHLPNQPLRWQGAENPMVHLGGRIAAQPVHVMRLPRDFDALLAQGNAARKRKKLRWQENTLAPVGGYVFRRAATLGEARDLLDAFLAEKAVQFADQGMHNVFAEPGVHAFLRDLIRRSFATGEPLIELFGVEIDGRVRATFAAGVEKGRRYGYFSAIAQDEFTRVSPGELLLHHLVRESCEAGLAEFDLGVGEERYKSSWATEPEEHFSVTIAATALGRAAVTGIRGWKNLELRVRHNPRLWALTKKLRRATASTVPKALKGD